MEGPARLKTRVFRPEKVNERRESEMIFGDQDLTQEFDPGSGRTLAACLTHASRTEIKISVFILVAHG